MINNKGNYHQQTYHHHNNTSNTDFSDRHSHQQKTLNSFQKVNNHYVSDFKFRGVVGTLLFVLGTCTPVIWSIYIVQLCFVHFAESLMFLIGVCYIPINNPSIPCLVL